MPAPAPVQRTYFRVCDSRFPFLWVSEAQPAGRWHGEGEGPVASLSTSAKGAWAELLRHEGITEPADLLDVECSLWAVEGPFPSRSPALDPAVLTGGEAGYPACRSEARRLRESGAGGLRTAAAALLSGRSERYAVDRSGTCRSDAVETLTVVLFASPGGSPFDLTGMPLAEGHPDPGILEDVRQI